MFHSFFKRLLGLDEESKEANRRFNQSLTALDRRERELSIAGHCIDDILNSVERKRRDLELSRAMAVVSGEHRIIIPAGGYIPEDIKDGTQSK